MGKRRHYQPQKEFDELEKPFKAAHEEFSGLADKVQMKLSGMDQEQWNIYCTNVEANFKLVGEKINKAFSEFRSEALEGNFDKAAKNMLKTLQGCVKGLQVAIVDCAESLGITNILRKVGIVENTPNKIMENLNNSINDISIGLKDEAINLGRAGVKKAEKFAEKAVSEGEKLFNKATDWMER